MVTTSDFQSGSLGSSPSRDHYSMRLDRGTGLIRAFIPPGQYIGTSLAEHQGYDWVCIDWISYHPEYVFAIQRW